VIGSGEQVPAAQVWIETDGDGFSLPELAADGPFLLLFYIFDWSTT
jgi:hypothetical protein